MTKQSVTYAVVEFRDAFALLDRLASDDELPTVDIEALMSVMYVTFEKSPTPAKALEDTLNWLFEADGFSTSLSKQCSNKRKSLRNLFHAALIGMQNELVSINPYVNGRLAWHYIERRGKYAAILATKRVPLPSAARSSTH